MQTECTLNAGYAAAALSSSQVSTLKDFLNDVGDHSSDYFIGVAVLAGRKVIADEIVAGSFPDTCFKLSASSSFDYQSTNCSQLNGIVYEFRHLVSTSPSVIIPGTVSIKSMSNTTLYKVPSPRTYDLSRAYCQSIGGDLTTVMFNQEAMNWIQSVSNVASMWVGIVDLDIPILLNGVPLDYIYRDPWSAGEPSDDSEKCVDAFGLDNGRLNDAPCDVSNGFICQFQPKMNYSADASVGEYRPYLRLSQAINLGIVQVFTTFQWKTVCINDINAAQVVCGSWVTVAVNWDPRRKLRMHASGMSSVMELKTISVIVRSPSA